MWQLLQKMYFKMHAMVGVVFLKLLHLIGILWENGKFILHMILGKICSRQSPNTVAQKVRNPTFNFRL